MRRYPVDKPLPRGQHVTIELGGGFGVIMSHATSSEFLKIELWKNDVLLTTTLEPKKELELAARILCKTTVDIKNESS
jgi:hypothetical protein